MKQQGLFFALMGLFISIHFSACRERQIPWELSEATGSHLSITDSMPGDSAIDALIAPYKKELDGIMNEVLCYSPQPITHQGAETPLGNLVADLSMEEVRAQGYAVDFCLLNQHGLRTELPQGDILRRHAFELMPFENELVIVTVHPDKFWELSTYLRASKGHPISGGRFHFKNGWIFTTIGGKAFEKQKYYKVLTTDYLYHGGDHMDFFAGNPMQKTGLKLRDAILNYFERSDTLRSNIDGRFHHENLSIQ